MALSPFLTRPQFMGAPQGFQPQPGPLMGGLGMSGQRPMGLGTEQPAPGGIMQGLRPRGQLRDLWNNHPEAIFSIAEGLTSGDFGGGLAKAGQAYTGKLEKDKVNTATGAYLKKRGFDETDIGAAMANPEIMKSLLGSGADGMTDDVKEYMFAVKNGGFQGTFTDWQTKGIREQDPTFKREMELRGQYDMLPEVKDYKVVKSNYERIRQGAQMGTGAGDAAIVFGFMKMLDPTSVVREGEQANARNAAGVPEQIQGLWNQLIGGGQLSEEARAQILAAADKVYQESSANIEPLNQRYGGIAGQYNLDPSRVVTEPEKYQPLVIGKPVKRGNVTIEKLSD
jgi:hypothetical protein